MPVFHDKITVQSTEDNDEESRPQIAKVKGNGFSVYTAVLNSLKPVSYDAVKHDDHDSSSVGVGISANTTDAVFSVLNRPQPVHRLDKATGGLLIVAKSRDALTFLTNSFSGTNLVVALILYRSSSTVLNCTNFHHYQLVPILLQTA